MFFSPAPEKYIYIFFMVAAVINEVDDSGVVTGILKEAEGLCTAHKYLLVNVHL